MSVTGRFGSNLPTGNSRYGLAGISTPLNLLIGPRYPRLVSLLLDIFRAVPCCPDVMVKDGKNLYLFWVPQYLYLLVPQFPAIRNRAPRLRSLGRREGFVSRGPRIIFPKSGWDYPLNMLAGHL